MKIVGAIFLVLGIIAAVNALNSSPPRPDASESYKTGYRLGRTAAPVVLIGLGLGLLLRRGGGPQRSSTTRPTTNRYAPPVAPPPAYPSRVPIAVQCSCGHLYEFEVEPIHGRMPNFVACPACGVDGTDAANASIAQTLAERAATPAWPQQATRQRRFHPALLVGGGVAALMLFLVAALLVRSFMRAHRMRQARRSPPPTEYSVPNSRPSPTPGVGGGSAPPPSKAGSKRDAAPVPPDVTAVDVFWGSRWYEATILRRDGQRAYIHYDGWSTTYDEWVTPDRMRPRR